MSSPTATATAQPAHIPPELSDLHCYTETDGVVTTTMFDLPGYRIVKVLGTVYGLTVRSRNWAAGLGMVLKSVVGGELRWYTNLVSIPCSLFSTSSLLSPWCVSSLLGRGAKCDDRKWRKGRGGSCRQGEPVGETLTDPASLQHCAGVLTHAEFLPSSPLSYCHS